MCSKSRKENSSSFVSVWIQLHPSASRLQSAIRADSKHWAQLHCLHFLFQSKCFFFLFYPLQCAARCSRHGEASRAAMNNSGRLLPGQRPLHTQVCLWTSPPSSAVLKHLHLLFLLPFISLKSSTSPVPVLIILFVSLRLLLLHRFLCISIRLLSLFHPTSLSLSLSPPTCYVFNLSLHLLLTALSARCFDSKWMKNSI